MASTTLPQLLPMSLTRSISKPLYSSGFGSPLTAAGSGRKYLINPNISPFSSKFSAKGAALGALAGPILKSMIDARNAAKSSSSASKPSTSGPQAQPQKSQSTQKKPTPPQSSKDSVLPTDKLKHEDPYSGNFIQDDKLYDKSGNFIADMSGAVKDESGNRYTQEGNLIDSSGVVYDEYGNPSRLFNPAIDTASHDVIGRDILEAPYAEEGMPKLDTYDTNLDFYRDDNTTVLSNGFLKDNFYNDYMDVPHSSYVDLGGGLIFDTSTNDIVNSGDFGAGGYDWTGTGGSGFDFGGGGGGGGGDFGGGDSGGGGGDFGGGGGDSGGGYYSGPTYVDTPTGPMESDWYNQLFGPSGADFSAWEYWAKDGGSIRKHAKGGLSSIPHMADGSSVGANLQNPLISGGSDSSFDWSSLLNGWDSFTSSGAALGSLLGLILGDQSSGGENLGVDMTQASSIPERTTTFGMGPANYYDYNQYSANDQVGIPDQAQLYQNLSAPGVSGYTPNMANGGSTGYYTFGRDIDPMDNLSMPQQRMAAGGSPVDWGNEYSQHRIDFRHGSSVNGPGDGQSDDIPAMLADGEYVIDAETVAMLGNGSNKAGAKALDEFRQNIRAHKRKTPLDKIPPKSKSPLAYLKGK